MTPSHICISRIHAGALAFLALLVLFGQSSVAAPPGPDGNRGHLNRLLHDHALIDHLGLTDDQARSAQAVSNDVVENHRAAFEKALKPETKAERVPLVKEVFISVNEDTFERLKNVISADQHQRLMQIEMQTFGIRAFGRPSVIEYLGLTSSQSDSLNKLGNSMGDKLSSIHSSSSLSSVEKEEATSRIRHAALQEARQYVEPEQWVKWELLTGAGFDQ